jgi:hypothetical protein
MALVDARGFQLTPDVSPLSTALGEALGIRAERQREDQLRQERTQAETLQQDFKETGVQFLGIRDLEDFTTQRKQLAILGQEAIRAGKDPTLFTDGLNINNPDELNLFLTRTARAAGNADKILERELRADEQADQIDGLSQVQSSEFLPGGGTRIVRKDGTVEVVQPTPDEKAIIQAGEDRGIDIQQRRAKGRGLGVGAAKVANQALETTDKMRANNIKLRRVIEEVRGGAQTGPLADRLPSFRASTRRLIQIKNELGLDVVGAVTFGALSEGELNLAMDTALPTTLDGPDLIEWAENKIAAQEKLANYLEEQAIFLSKPGNTAADWLERGRNQKAIREQQPAQPATQGAGRFTIEVIE